MTRIWFVVFACLGLLAAACASDDPVESAGQAEETSTTEAAAPEAPSERATASESAAPGSETAEDLPERIVSLSPTATEMLYAIGAGDQVVAVDDRSNFPEGTPVTDLSAFKPNLEAIITHDPDLVVLSFDPGEIATGLEQVDVPVLVHPAAVTLEDTYDQITDLGEATGHEDEAAEVVAEMQERIEEITADVEGQGSGEPISVYHELDATFFSASSNTFIGELYGMLGLENIADEADSEAAGGYPQLSPEYILAADPDLIVITDEAGYAPQDVTGRPGWNAISAVAEGNVMQVDADLSSRWGPRVVEFLDLVAERVASIQAA